MKVVNNFLVVLIVCLIFLLVSSCVEDFDSAIGVSYMDIEGVPNILNNNPGPHSVGRLFEGYSLDELESLSKDFPDAMYLMALVKFGNIPKMKVSPDPVAGRHLLEEAWRLGIVDAGYSLYEVYSKGVGVEVDNARAFSYLESSAELGYIKSQQTLGFVLSGRRMNDFLEIDFSLARDWFEQAAKQGDAISALNLAGLYRAGKGGEADLARAYYWASSAENMRYGDAVYSFRTLAKYNEEGVGTDIDLVQAYKYYDLLSPGSAPDKTRLEAQMTPEQIREAIRLSRQWQEEHNIFVPSYYGLEYQEDGTFH